MSLKRLGDYGEKLPLIEGIARAVSFGKESSRDSLYYGMDFLSFSLEGRSVKFKSYAPFKINRGEFVRLHLAEYDSENALVAGVEVLKNEKCFARFAGAHIKRKTDGSTNRIFYFFED